MNDEAFAGYLVPDHGQRSAEPVQPEECDYCGYETANLELYADGPPIETGSWLCPYCALDHTKGQNQVVRALAGMFNELEKRLRNS